MQLKILEKNYSNKGTIFIVLTSTKSLFVILKLGITNKGSKLKPISQSKLSYHNYDTELRRKISEGKGRCLVDLICVIMWLFF